MKRIVIEPFDNIGEPMKIEEFKENTECGGFNDDDGDGVLGCLDTKGQVWMTNISVSCDVAWLERKRKQGWSLVIWYNK